MSLATALTQEIGVVVDAAEQAIVGKVRTALNQSGIIEARRGLDDAEARLAHAMEGLRDWQAKERDAKEALALVEAEQDWAVSAGFTKTGNSWSYEDKPCTAEQKTGLIAVALAKVPAVIEATAAYRKARSEREAMTDAVTLAEKNLTAARIALEGAVAQLNLWAAALKGS